MIVTDLSQDSCHARGLQARLLRCRRLWSTLHKGRQGCVLPGTSPIDSRGRLTWHAQKFETSLQTQRGQEGRSQNCWIRQFWRGASVRKNISLHLRKTFICCLSKRSALRESLLETWNVDTHTQSAAHF